MSRPPIPELSRIAWTAYSNIGSARNETRPVYRLPPEILALIIGFYQFDFCYWEDYGWVRLMLVSRMWRTTILSFPLLWSKLVLNASTSQSGMLALVDRSGSHPLEMEIPCEDPDMYRRSVYYKHIGLMIKHLPRVSRLTIRTRGTYNTLRVCRMFRGSTADQLLELELMGPEEFVLCAPRLQYLSIFCMKTWPLPLSENLTRIFLDSHFDPEALERGLKNCPRLKEISIHKAYCQFDVPPGDLLKIPLLPGVRLIIRDSHTSVASLFALGPTNFLSVEEDLSSLTSRLPHSSSLTIRIPHSSNMSSHETFRTFGTSSIPRWFT